MKRTLSFLFAMVMAVLGWVIVAPTAAGTVPEQPCAAYAYDVSHNVAFSATTSTERGPPAVAYDYTAAPSADDHGSSGALARPHPGSIWTYTTYDHTVQSAHPDSARVMARTASGGCAASMRSARAVSVAANAAPETAQSIIQSTARVEAGRGAEALSGSLSAAERAAMAENPGLANAFLGQAVHRNTAAALEKAFPGRFWHRTRGPDFVDRWTGEMLELTTPSQVGSHLARPGYSNVTMCTYVVPSC